MNLTQTGLNLIIRLCTITEAHVKNVVDIFVLTIIFLRGINLIGKL